MRACGRIWTAVGGAVAVAAVAAGVATAGMHATVGATLSGMGEHGVVNLQLKAANHEICWTFDLMAKGETAASIRDAHGMRVAALGSGYSAKGCGMVPAKAIALVEANPAAYWVWVDTKGHPGDLRGRLSAGMAHM